MTQEEERVHLLQASTANRTESHAPTTSGSIENGGTSLAGLFTGAISIALAIITLILAALLTLIAILSHDPSKSLNNTMVMPTIFSLSSAYYILTMSCMVVQGAIFWKWKPEALVDDPHGFNRFLRNVMLFVFLPLSEVCIFMRLIRDVLLLPCESVIYTVRSLTEVMFILLLAVYTTIMARKRVVGSKALVIYVKSIILLVAVACMCIWIYRTMAEATDRIQGMPFEEYLPHDCNLDNTTRSWMRMYRNVTPYLFPYLLELTLACATLLYRPFYKSKVRHIVGLVVSPHLEKAPSLPPLRLRRVPLFLGVTAFGFCIAMIGYSLSLHEKYEIIQNSSSSFVPRDVYGDVSPYHYIDITVSVIIIAATSLLSYQMIFYSTKSIDLSADRVLLWISATGPILKSVFHMVGPVIFFSLDSTNHLRSIVPPETVLRDCFTETFFFIQVVWQTIVLDVSLRRRVEASTTHLRQYQPALILLFANVGRWFGTCYDYLPYVYLSRTYGSIYGEITYGFVTVIAKPLHALQCIHSSSLLYEIFRAAE